MEFRNLGTHRTHIVQSHRALKDIGQNASTLTQFEKDNSKWSKYLKWTKNQCMLSLQEKETGSLVKMRSGGWVAPSKAE